MSRDILDDYIERHLDIVPTHPEWSAEEYDEHIEKLIEEDKRLTEWPDI